MSDDALHDLLRAAPLAVRRGPFALGARLAPPAVCQGLLRRRSDVLLFLQDDREVTALCRHELLADLPPPRQVQRGWALITLDQAMDWELSGVLAALATRLAAAGIPIGAGTAFSRDHLLVPGERLEQALAALDGLCGEVRFVD
jgi:hypothetical protein